MHTFLFTHTRTLPCGPSSSSHLSSLPLPLCPSSQINQDCGPCPASLLFLGFTTSNDPTYHCLAQGLQHKTQNATHYYLLFLVDRIFDLPQCQWRTVTAPLAIYRLHSTSSATSNLPEDLPLPLVSSPVHRPPRSARSLPDSTRMANNNTSNHHSILSLPKLPRLI